MKKIEAAPQPDLAEGYPKTEYLKGLPQQDIQSLLLNTQAVLEAIGREELTLSDEEKAQFEQDPRALLKTMFKARARCLAVLGKELVPAILLSDTLGVQIHPYQKGLGQFPRFSTSGAAGGKSVEDGSGAKGTKGAGKVWIDEKDMQAANEHNARVKGIGRGDKGEYRDYIAPIQRAQREEIPTLRGE